MYFSQRNKQTKIPIKIKDCTKLIFMTSCLFGMAKKVYYFYYKHLHMGSVIEMHRGLDPNIVIYYYLCNTLILSEETYTVRWF